MQLIGNDQYAASHEVKMLLSYNAKLLGLKRNVEDVASSSSDPFSSGKDSWLGKEQMLESSFDPFSSGKGSWLGAEK